MTKNIALADNTVAFLNIFKQQLGKHFSYNTAMRKIIQMAKLSSDGSSLSNRGFNIEFMKGFRNEFIQEFITNLENWDIRIGLATKNELANLINLFCDMKYTAIIEICENKLKAIDQINKKPNVRVNMFPNSLTKD